MTEEAYMRIALELAEKGWGWTSPNPLVGAVIVKDGRIIGKGWHEAFGQAHAERNALASCTVLPKDATLYVTLEPCCHFGKQPPCTDAILQAGIRRVVVGSPDPNPLVAGKGIAQLRQNGVEVVEDCLRADCDRLNEIFFHYIRTERPFVLMKYAMTLDGKIAAHTGNSKWVTGPGARAHVQRLRARYAAIMVGVGTVLADNPLLTCRLPDTRQPVRVICDSNLRTPLSSNVVASAHQTPTWIATCCRDEAKRRAYEQAGCQILLTDPVEGRVDLPELMRQLGQRQIDSVLLEGGGTLNWAALKSGVVQKVSAYIAPKLFGGWAAKTPVEGLGVASPDDAFLLRNAEVQCLDGEFLVEAEVEDHVHGDH